MNDFEYNNFEKARILLKYQWEGVVYFVRYPTPHSKWSTILDF